MALTWGQRFEQGRFQSSEIVRSVWLYVVIGIAIGAGIHGYVPTDFITQYAGANNPFAVEFDLTQPLTLTTSMGQTLTAKDISSEISQDTPTPANVGEYGIKSVLPQLQAEIPLHLTLPMVTGSAIELQIPSVAIQEWQALSAR